MKTRSAERDARIGFATSELLWQALTAKRWELLKRLSWSRPGVYPRGGAARGSRREGRAWRRDGAAATPDCSPEPTYGAILFPYDAVKVEFMLRAA